MKSRVITALAAGLLAACSGGTVSPKVAADIAIGCQVDAQVQPLSAALLAELAPDAGSTDTALVHPAVVAACAAVKGKPVNVATATAAGVAVVAAVDPKDAGVAAVVGLAVTAAAAK